MIITEVVKAATAEDDYEKLIDFYHTEEHLSKAAKALFGKRNAQARAWHNKYRVKLLEKSDGAVSVNNSHPG